MCKKIRGGNGEKEYIQFIPFLFVKESVREQQGRLVRSIQLGHGHAIENLYRN